MPTLTIDFSMQHAARIQASLEESMELKDENGDPRPATLADLKAYVIADVRNFVRNSEKRVARQLAEQGVDYVDLT
jgi:hypothetical protein